MSFRYDPFDQALRLLNGRLSLTEAPAYKLVVCGGTALIATELVLRATRDVDIVALADGEGRLIDPAPAAAIGRGGAGGGRRSRSACGLVEQRAEPGRRGIVPDGAAQGFAERLTWRSFGDKLAVGFIGRFDQIHFKLYAAVDQLGSYHATDLQALAPSDAELLAAAAWTRTHDPSTGYLQSLKWFLKEFGYERVAGQI